MSEHLVSHKADVTIPVYGTIADADVYLKDKVDAILNEKNKALEYARELTIKDIKIIDEQKAEIAELKAKLESVQASAYADSVDAGMRERRLKRELWSARAERYKMREFIAREEAKLSAQISWSQYLRERTYNQWVDQLLRIANLANKLQNKCLKKVEEWR